MSYGAAHRGARVKASHRMRLEDREEEARAIVSEGPEPVAELWLVHAFDETGELVMPSIPAVGRRGWHDYGTIGSHHEHGRAG